LRSTRLDLIGLLKLRCPLLYKGEGKTIINISSEAASYYKCWDQLLFVQYVESSLTMMNQMFANLLKDKGFKVYAVHLAE